MIPAGKEVLHLWSALIPIVWQPAGPRTIYLRPRRQPAGLHARQRRPACGTSATRSARRWSWPTSKAR